MIILAIFTLFKKGKQYDMNNYRPIVEKISDTIFLHFIVKHNLLYIKQYGFIRNSSNSHVLYRYYNVIES